MKSLFAVLLIMALAVPGLAQSKTAGKKNVVAEEATITGEIIDVKCYTTGMMGGRGPEHADCAVSCIKNGLPVGVVDDKTDQVYVIVPARGTKGANEALLPYVAKRVTLKGKIIEKGGTKLLAYTSVEEAK